MGTTDGPMEYTAMPTATTIASRRWADKRIAHGSRSLSFTARIPFTVIACTAEVRLRGRNGVGDRCEAPDCPSPCSDPINVAIFDPHTVAPPQVEVARLLDDQRAARIESHGDAVSRRLPLLLLDCVSDDRAADCAGDGGRRVPAAASDLVADHATGDAP